LLSELNEPNGETWRGEPTSSIEEEKRVSSKLLDDRLCEPKGEFALPLGRSTGDAALSGGGRSGAGGQATTDGGDPGPRKGMMPEKSRVTTRLSELSTTSCTMKSSLSGAGAPRTARPMPLTAPPDAGWLPAAPPAAPPAEPGAPGAIGGRWLGDTPVGPPAR
jgi:hypothetical protein